MARLEVSCRRFAMFGGMQIDASAYAICVHPNAPGLQRRGTLALISEPVGSVTLGADACRLAQRAVVEGYFSDHSLGLTSSLLNALDGANNALLQYGAGWTGGEGAGESAGSGAVATQTGVKTRRVRVGMTALLLRPDGTGVYLSQMAPTQVYILHNGIVSALPEPAGWTPAPSRTVVTLKRLLTGEDEEAEGDDLSADLSTVVVPAASLGSGPGVEADLIYRRIEPGDKIVLVSSGLAREIERQWAEDLMPYDADTIVEALSDLARARGLAEAHACVLELGVPVSSGVDSDYTAPVAPKASLQVAQEGGVSAEPNGTQKAGPRAGLIEALRGPRDWFTKRRNEGEGTTEEPEGEPSEAPAPLETGHNLETEEPLWQGLDDMGEPVEQAEGPDHLDNGWSRQPTQLFVQRSPDVPPYQAQMEGPFPASINGEPSEELQFDGWEDAPPALDDPRYGETHRVIFKPKVLDDAELEDAFADGYNVDAVSAHDQVAAHAQVQNSEPALKAKTGGFDLATNAQKVVAWGGQALAAILPRRVVGALTAGRPGARGMLLPLRVVILAALAVVGIVLVVSLLSMRGSAEQAVTRNLLAEAQQLQMAANQPGLTEAERIEKLQLALDKANEAVADDPQSEEARRLVGKLSVDLDTAQGITRLTSLKLLFDLDAIDSASSPGTQAGQQVQPPTTDEAPTASVENDVIAQGNDVYVLDMAKSRVYRCQIAAKSCSPVLSAGDTVGGEKVGEPMAITLRVGSPVVLDESLVSYVFSADTGGWLAQPLGGAEGLQKPLGIASYDGNLYLLGSKAGQISKYLSGQYGQPPLDWITDGPTAEAMKQPVAMSIDGVIYVALADGRVLAMQGGKLTATFAPKSTPGSGAPTQLFTNTDIRDIYLLRSSDGSITRLTKEGQTLATYKAPADAGLTGFSGLAVDEGRNRVYLSHNRKVYEATLPASGAKTTPAIQAEPQSPALDAPQGTDKPSVKPTVEP